jgi:hypothetical protein
VALPAVRAVTLVSALLVVGCSVDAPRTPQFETQVFLPLGIRTTTGLDLIDDGGYIEGDSAGVAALRFVLRGTMDSVQVGPLLDLDLPATGFSLGLDGVRLVSERPLRASILLPSLCDQFGPDPRETLNVSIAPFAVPSVSRAVSPPEDISWVHLERGLLRITLRNYLPVPLGGGSGAPVRVRLRDRATGLPLAAGELTEPIAPGATGVTETRLDGVALSADLDLELSGSSPGSGGVPVDVHAADRVELEVSFADLTADSAYAVVPVQSFTTTGMVQLAEDMEISEGLIRGGAVRFTLENPYPVVGIGRVTLPSVYRTADTSEPVFAAIELPAASDRGPGRGETTFDLAGVVLRPAGGSGGRLEYLLDIETRRSGGRVRIGTRASAHGMIDQGRVSFDVLSGRLDGRRFEISPTETSLDPPEGIDSLSFESASLALEITSTIAFPAEAELTVIGEPADGTARVSVPLRFSVGAADGGAPRVTTITVDETNSNILALLTARPRKMLISGELRVGDGEEGTIRRADRIWGGYTLCAPLRMRIGRITHRTEPSHATISRDDQDLIRENILEATARGTVTNHFPAGLDVRLVLAGTEADLALDPATHADRVLSLDPVVVAPGETDPVTGRVVRARVTPLEVTIRPDQVAFFARDELYSQAVLVVSGEDAQRTVELTALDFVEVTAMLHFRVWVKQ